MIRIVNLVENTKGVSGCLPAHGLSLYVETPRHRLLMDAGPGAMLVDNAEALDVDLSAVDTVVLSHGHYDHADGLPAFRALNPRAAIYLRQSALDAFYSDDGEKGLRYIGMAPEVFGLSRLNPISGTLRIDDELTLFGDITGRKYWPQANLRHRRKTSEAVIQDDYSHEQCLALFSEGRRVLLSGCAHSGILNILERYESLFDAAPDVVISGFHMMKQSEYGAAERQTIIDTARALKRYPTRFYTCHCTGLPAYEMMKAIMSDQLHYLHCGETMEID